MEYSVSKISFLTPDEVETLRRENIYTTDDLIARGNTHNKRKQIAQLCNIRIEKVNSIVSIADLVRVRGIGIERASILHFQFSINDIYSLISISDKNEITEQICSKLKVSLPVLNMLINNAKSLNTGISLNSLNEKEVIKKFKEQILSEVKTLNKFSARFNLWLFVIITVAAFIAFISSYYNYYISAINIDANLKHQFGINQHFFLKAFIIGIVSMSIIATTILLVFFVWLNYLNKISQYISYRFVRPWIFNSPFYMNGYINYKLNKVQKSHFKVLKPSLILLAVTVVIFLLISSLIDVTDYFYYFSVTSIVFFVVLFIVVYKISWKSWSLIKPISTSSMKKRLMFVTSIEMIITLIVIILTFYLLFKPTYYGSVKIVIAIKEKVKSNQIKQLKTTLNLYDEPDVNKSYIIKVLEEQYNIIDDFDASNYSEILNMFNIKSITGFINILSLIAIIAMSFSFLIPYLILNGLRNTSLFIIAIFLSIILSEIINKQSDTFFFIEVGYAGYYIFLFSMSLLITTYVDTLYDIFSKRIICDNCQFEITDHVNFCPNCGINIENKYLDSHSNNKDELK